MKELVDVYVQIGEKWELLFKDIPEDIASGIWMAGFKTGKNKFSIESKKDRDFFEKQMEKLHK